MRPGESFIEQPIRSLQTMLRVIAENDRRYPTVVPDGIYGPTTMQAVSAIQRQNGLPVTGVTDQETWEYIYELYEPALIQVDKATPIEVTLDPGEIFRFGDSSPYIYLVQGMLTQLSNDNPTISATSHNGILDESTSASLLAFQILANLEATGELDKITWKHLVLHFSSNAQKHTNENKGNNNYKF